MKSKKEKKQCVPCAAVKEVAPSRKKVCYHL